MATRSAYGRTTQCVGPTGPTSPKALRKHGFAAAALTDPRPLRPIEFGLSSENLSAEGNSLRRIRKHACNPTQRPPSDSQDAEGSHDHRSSQAAPNRRFHRVRGCQPLPRWQPKMACRSSASVDVLACRSIPPRHNARAIGRVIACRAAQSQRMPQSPTRRMCARACPFRRRFVLEVDEPTAGDKPSDLSAYVVQGPRLGQHAAHQVPLTADRLIQQRIVSPKRRRLILTLNNTQTESAKARSDFMGVDPQRHRCGWR